MQYSEKRGWAQTKMKVILVTVFKVSWRRVGYRLENFGQKNPLIRNIHSVYITIDSNGEK